jgi:hypothetical protein
MHLCSVCMGSRDLQKLGVLEEPGLVLDTGSVRCIPYVGTTVLGTYCAMDGGPIGQFLDQKICWNSWKVWSLERLEALSDYSPGQPQLFLSLS